MSRGHVLDLTKHHFAHQVGDLMIYGTWIGDDIDEVEPALVLVPAYRAISHERTRPCCIALSSAWKYNESPEYLLQAAMQFNKALGRSDEMSQVHKVAEVIHDHLLDLIKMPPLPLEEGKVAAEATITDSTGRTMEAVIRDFD